MGMIRFRYLRPVKGCVVSHYDSRWSKYSFKQGFEDSHVLNVVVRPETKTSLHISVSPDCPDHRDTFSISMALDGFKTLERYVDCLFGDGEYRYYFKVTKKQGLSRLQDYILQALQEAGVPVVSTHDVTIKMRFYDTDKMTINIADEVEVWED